MKIRKHLFKDTPIANVYAFLLFVLAKCCAMAGVAFGWSATYYTVGAFLLGFAVLFLAASVVICVLEMKRQNAIEEAAKREAEADRDLLQKMVDDGSLAYLLLKKGVPAKRRKELLENLGLPDHCVVETAPSAN